MNILDIVADGLMRAMRWLITAGLAAILACFVVGAAGALVKLVIGLLYYVCDTISEVLWHIREWHRTPYEPFSPSVMTIRTGCLPCSLKAGQEISFSVNGENVMYVVESVGLAGWGTTAKLVRKDSEEVG